MQCKLHGDVGGIQISGSSINGEEDEDEEDNSASEEDEEEDHDDGEIEDDDAEISCNTPTTVRRVSPVDMKSGSSKKPFYSDWFKGRQNSKSSSDDKEKDKESIV